MCEGVSSGPRSKGRTFVEFEMKDVITKPVVGFAERVSEVLRVGVVEAVAIC